MSYWLNHDSMAIDRYARQNQDRQRLWNVAGTAALAAGNYALYRMG